MVELSPSPVHESVNRAAHGPLEIILKSFFKSLRRSRLPIPCTFQLPLFLLACHEEVCLPEHSTGDTSEVILAGPGLLTSGWFPVSCKDVFLFSMRMPL